MLDGEDSSRLAEREEIVESMQEHLLPGVEAKQLRNSVLSRVFGAKSDPVKIGRYTVLKRIGSGGMGTVYAAYDTELDRKVAVKILRGELRWSDRLRREPQALARLSHPNVVQVYDVGEHEGELFLSMEFVGGLTLSEWTTRQERTWREILDAYMQAGRGLAAAHDAGIIHRDFKPQNVLVGRDGRVRVLDFGLARGRASALHDEAASESPDPEASGALLRPITRSGAVMGTRQYMAPEQHRGEDADERADQFSFCVALYEALYGRRPFRGTTEEELERSVLSGQLQPPPLDASVPKWLGRVVAQGLSAEREKRFGSMEALLDALSKDPVVYVRRVVLGGAITAVVVVAGVIWSVREEQHRLQQARLEVEKEAERDEKIAEQRKKEALERDLQRRADALTFDEAARVEMDRDPTRAVARLARLTPDFEGWSTAARVLAADAAYRGVADHVLQLPDGEVAHGLSPDGTTVVTRNPSTGDIRLRSIDGDASTLLAKGGTMPELAFSPDGTRVAALRLPDGLRVWEIAGEHSERLGEADDGHYALEYDPTGALLVYGRSPELHRWRGSTREILPGHHDRVVGVAVREDGELAATVDAIGRSRLWNLATLESTPLEGAGPVAFSPKGRLAVVDAGGDVSLSYPDDVLGETSESFEGLGVGVAVLVFSPDGDRMAAGTVDGRFAWWHIPSGRRTDLPGMQDEVESLRFVDDDTLGATSLADLVLHDTNGAQPQFLRGHGGVGFWAGREDGRVVTVGHEGTVRVWTPRESGAHALTGHDGEIVAVAAVADGGWFSADDRGVVRRWDAGLQHAALVGDSGGEAVVALVSTREGAFAWSAADGSIWASTPAGEPRRVHTFDAGVDALAWSPTGALVVAPSSGGVERWEVGSDTATKRSDLDGMVIHAIGFTDDGALRVLAYDEHERYFVLRVGSDGVERSRSPLDTIGVLAADFSPTGDALAFSGDDRSVSVWEADTGTQRQLGQHDGLVGAVAFSPDGASIVTAGEDGGVRVWDVETGFWRTVPSSDGPLHAVAVSKDGDRFIAVGRGSTGSVAFVGTDDLPRGAHAVRAWVERATDLTVETEPIAWAGRGARDVGWPAK